ncbi:MAG: DUF309 domain-containing protein [Calothrix sp. FI2-JRJ7]|jgi:hypothetical protein|nr:DUF309 domain-containing protein [Calothrix sp. FI2-JRJ7]
MKEEMPSQYWQGVEQFNTGQFYACHDTLEALWIEALEPEKTFYQGILQVAVALYHLGNGNLRGATILLGEGTNRLRRYPSVFGGVDVDEFLDQSVALLKILQHTQPEMITNLIPGEDERFPIPKILLV